MKAIRAGNADVRLTIKDKSGNASTSTLAVEVITPLSGIASPGRINASPVPIDLYYNQYIYLSLNDMTQDGKDTAARTQFRHHHEPRHDHRSRRI